MSETDSDTARAELPEPQPAEPVAEAERAATRLRSSDLLRLNEVCFPQLDQA